MAHQTKRASPSQWGSRERRRRVAVLRENETAEKLIESGRGDILESCSFPLPFLLHIAAAALAI